MLSNVSHLDWPSIGVESGMAVDPPCALAGESDLGTGRATTTTVINPSTGSYDQVGGEFNNYTVLDPIPADKPGGALVDQDDTTTWVPGIDADAKFTLDAGTVGLSATHLRLVTSGADSLAVEVTTWYQSKAQDVQVRRANLTVTPAQRVYALTADHNADDDLATGGRVEIQTLSLVDPGPRLFQVHIKSKTGAGAITVHEVALLSQSGRNPAWGMVDTPAHAFKGHVRCCDVPPLNATDDSAAAGSSATTAAYGSLVPNTHRAGGGWSCAWTAQDVGMTFLEAEIDSWYNSGCATCATSSGIATSRACAEHCGKIHSLGNGGNDGVDAAEWSLKRAAGECTCKRKGALANKNVTYDNNFGTRGLLIANKAGYTSGGSATCTRIRYATCEEAYAHGEIESGEYLLTGRGTADGDLTYCEMTVFGGGWELVAHAVGTGNWPSFDLNFNPGAESVGVYSSIWGDRSTASKDYYRAHAHLIYGINRSTTSTTTTTSRHVSDAYAGDTAQVLFLTGDEQYWCVIPWQSLQYASDSETELNTQVLGAHSSDHATVEMRPRGGWTNIKSDYNDAAPTPADPAVGCAGTHAQNINAGLLWSEAGASVNTAFKNAHGGVGVFVRRQDPPRCRPLLSRTMTSTSTSSSSSSSSSSSGTGGLVKIKSTSSTAANCADTSTTPSLASDGLLHTAWDVCPPEESSAVGSAQDANQDEVELDITLEPQAEGAQKACVSEVAIVWSTQPALEFAVLASNDEKGEHFSPLVESKGWSAASIMQGCTDDPSFYMVIGDGLTEIGGPLSICKEASSNTKQPVEQFYLNGQVNPDDTNDLTFVQCCTITNGTPIQSRPSCVEGKTWRESADLCAAGGKRLCTQAEVLAKGGNGVGCNANNNHVWTSTPCGPNNATTFPPSGLCVDSIRPGTAVSAKHLRVQMRRASGGGAKDPRYGIREILVYGGACDTTLDGRLTASVSFDLGALGQSLADTSKTAVPTVSLTSGAAAGARFLPPLLAENLDTHTAAIGAASGDVISVQIGPYSSSSSSLLTMWGTADVTSTATDGRLVPAVVVGDTMHTGRSDGIFTSTGSLPLTVRGLQRGHYVFTSLHHDTFETPGQLSTFDVSTAGSLLAYAVATSVGSGNISGSASAATFYPSGVAEYVIAVTNASLGTTDNAVSVEYASTGSPAHRAPAAGLESNANGRSWVDANDDGYGDGWSVSVGVDPTVTTTLTGTVPVYHPSTATQEIERSGGLSGRYQQVVVTTSIDSALPFNISAPTALSVVAGQAYRLSLSYSGNASSFRVLAGKHSENSGTDQLWVSGDLTSLSAASQYDASFISVDFRALSTGNVVLSFETSASYSGTSAGTTVIALDNVALVALYDSVSAKSSHAQAARSCLARGMALCTARDYCPHGPGTLPVGGGFITQRLSGTTRGIERWAPVAKADGDTSGEYNYVKLEHAQDGGENGHSWNTVGSTGPTVAEKTVCLDAPPDSLHTCAEHSVFGNCSNAAMNGHCCETCFGCSSACKAAPQVEWLKVLSQGAYGATVRVVETCFGFRRAKKNNF
jgi:hypothetical protein